MRELKKGVRPVAVEALGLSWREAEVLSWVSYGKTNAEIGTILDLSPRTVQKHLEHTFQKLGVENRTAAAARAFEISSRANQDLLNQSILTYLIFMGSTGLV
jgi:DNA-binding CsgD family transcriptional regulator